MHLTQPGIAEREILRELYILFFFPHSLASFKNPAVCVWVHVCAQCGGGGGRLCDQLSITRWRMKALLLVGGLRTGRRAILRLWLREILVGLQARGGTAAAAGLPRPRRLWPPSSVCCWGCPDYGGWRKWHRRWIWCTRRRCRAACSRGRTGEGTPLPQSDETSCVRACGEDRTEGWNVTPWVGCV